MRTEQPTKCFVPLPKLRASLVPINMFKSNRKAMHRIGNIRELNGCAVRLLGAAHCTTTITLLIKVIEKQCTGTGVIKRQIPLFKQYSIKMEWS